MKILTAQQMREMDRLTVEQTGIPYAILMETAGAKVVEAIISHYGSVTEKSFSILCGTGNNGGDGAVIARHLWMLDEPWINVYLYGKLENTKGEARTNFEIIKRLAEKELEIKKHVPRLTFKEITDEDDAGIYDGSDFVIDALFGTGLSRAITGTHKLAIESINYCKDPATVVSVDIPSGLSSDSGQIIGSHVNADLTVTFTAPKYGNIFHPAAAANGKLVVVPIGTPDYLLQNINLSLVEKEHIAQYLKDSQRPSDVHKNSVGDVLLIAGSRGKTGAAALSASAIMRAGAGLVTVATSVSAQALLINQLIPEVMTEVLPETVDGTISDSAVELALKLASKKTVVAIGPGLSSTDESMRKFVLEFVKRRTCPIVIDADGLNALAPWPEELKGSEELPIIITPHPGEMARLTGKSNSEIVADPVNIAHEFAKKHSIITIIKGSRTVIAAPYWMEKQQFVNVFINPTGNAGMATAGSGDVLTGIISGLLSQQPHDNPDEIFIGRAARDAALAGVYLHGLAGDLAAEKLGQRSLIASDIINHISQAFLHFE